MRKAFTLLLILCAAFAKGQLYDAQWAIASNLSFLDFRTDTPTTTLAPNTLQMFLTDANICDSSGNMLFITNGVNIYGGSGQQLPNGNNLSPCNYTSIHSGTGLNIQQATLFLPAPGKPDTFYLFHFSNDSLGDSRPGTLFYSLLWDSLGTGIVLKKNIPFCVGPFREGGITACKHANGRDYWIVMGGYHNNSFYKFLLTPDSLFGPFIQNIGPISQGPYDLAYCKFSQDGSRFVSGIGVGLITVYDFDRCEGNFSNPVTIYNEGSTNPQHPTSACASAEFSPNGRFVYLSDNIDLNQYDLWAPNIQDSVQLYKAVDTEFAHIAVLQLAPNGKLYGSCWSGGFYFLHVINEPDKLGDSCGFVYGGFMTPTINSFQLPNMVNYGLGPVDNSACDTLGLGLKPPDTNTVSLHIAPNPTDKYAYVEVGTPADYEIQLLNENGQLITTKQTRQVDIFNTEHLAAGVYFMNVTNRQTQKQVAVKKLVVVH